ncbi:MAG TPA: response regulator [Anaeromyxobacteraceae bacterium]|nr:response regulator [Anaeromyxobacteraceae bacterium]
MLLVDHRSDRLPVPNVLERLGAKVDLARSIGEAAAALSRGRHDVVLCRHPLQPLGPEASLTLARWIRRHRPDAGVLLLARRPDYPTRSWLRRYGVGVVGAEPVHLEGRLARALRSASPDLAGAQAR